MAHRAAPISVSIALGHASVNAVKATAGDWSTGSSASITFPLHSHMSSARQESSEYHFWSLWYDSAGLEPMTYRLWGRRSTTGPSLRLNYDKKRPIWYDEQYDQWNAKSPAAWLSFLEYCTYYGVAPPRPLYAPQYVYYCVLPFLKKSAGLPCWLNYDESFCIIAAMHLQSNIF